MFEVDNHPGPPARHQLLPTFLGEGSPTKINYRKKVGALILTSLLDLVDLQATEVDQR